MRLIALRGGRLRGRGLAELPRSGRQAGCASGWMDRGCLSLPLLSSLSYLSSFPRVWDRANAFSPSLAATSMLTSGVTRTKGLCCVPLARASITSQVKLL